MKTKLLICFLASLLVWLLTAWTQNFEVSAPWTGCACYFVLTYLLLEQYDDGAHCVVITAVIAAARLVVALIPMFSDFRAGRFALFVPIVSVASMILAALYHRHRSGTVLVLSAVILILINTLGPTQWAAEAN